MSSYDTDAMILGSECGDPDCRWCALVRTTLQAPWRGDDYSPATEDLWGKLDTEGVK